MAIRNGQKKGAHCHLPTITNAIPLIHRIIIKNRPCRGIGRLGQGPHRLERSGRGLGKREHEVYTAKRHGLAYNQAVAFVLLRFTFLPIHVGVHGRGGPCKAVRCKAPLDRTKKPERFGTGSTTAWYRQYHGVVVAVPRRGIHSTTVWYRPYHAVVATPPKR